jgi:hypothetical protein
MNVVTDTQHKRSKPWLRHFPLHEREEEACMAGHRVGQRCLGSEKLRVGGSGKQAVSLVWFGTRVLVGISGDNPHQTPNPHSLLKIRLVLVYWTSLIPANPHFFLNFSVFFSIPNTLLLPSGLWMGFCEDWIKAGVLPNTLGNYPH